MSYKNIFKNKMQVNSLNLDVAKLLNKYVCKAVKDLYGINLNPDFNYIDIPRTSEHGVFSTNISFVVAKSLSKKPEQIAKELSDKLREILPLIDGRPSLFVSTINAFINFKIAFSYLKFILKNLYSTFGVDKILLQDHKYKKQTVVIEYASPNPNKVMHSGHLRNIVIATPLINAYRALGAKVYTDMVLNDKGIAISKVMVGYLYYARKGRLFKAPDRLTIKQALDVNEWYSFPQNWETPKTAGMLPDYFVDKLYVLGSALVKESHIAQRVAQYFVEEWELGNKKVYKLWELIVNWGITGQQRIFKQLGCTFDTVWRESDHYLLGKRIVKKGLQAGLLKIDKKEKKGAVIADLRKQNLGKFVLLRSDGTSLYSTQDVSLAKLKVDRYKANSYIYVVGSEQSTHFAQLFSTLKLLGIIKNENLIHMSYALLLLNGKKTSSREGGALYIDTFLDYIKDYLQKNFDLNKDSRSKLADLIARVAITKVGANKAFNFDIKEASNPKGHTGAYLMYTYVRALNILKRNEVQYPTYRWLDHLSPVIIALHGKDSYLQALTTQDLELMNKLIYLPFYLKQSVDIKDPSVLVNYAFALADVFNSYYEKILILKSSSDVKEFRLYLVHSVKSTLRFIIEILGGQVIEYM